MKTIAIDFDGVIHKYSSGWQDGTIYDEPIDGSLEAIRDLLKQGYSVFIFSTRSPRQIKRWLDDKYPFFGNMTYDLSHGGYLTKVIPFWKKFWNEKEVLGITKRKLPAHIYVDDRAYKFEGDWKKTLDDLIKSS